MKSVFSPSAFKEFEVGFQNQAYIEYVLSNIEKMFFTAYEDDAIHSATSIINETLKNKSVNYNEASYTVTHFFIKERFLLIGLSSPNENLIVNFDSVDYLNVIKES